MLTISNSPHPLLEYFMHRNSTRSQGIYIVVLVALFAIVALLPIIKVTLTMQCVGIIRPFSELTEMKSLASDMVEQVFVLEYKTVPKNAPIQQLRTNTIDSKLQFYNIRKQKYMGLLRI